MVFHLLTLFALEQASIDSIKTWTMNMKCTLVVGSIYISIISITKELIHKGREPTLDCINVPPRLLKKEINTLSTCEAQIYTQEWKKCINNRIENIIKLNKLIILETNIWHSQEIVRRTTIETISSAARKMLDKWMIKTQSPSGY